MRLERTQRQLAASRGTRTPKDVLLDDLEGRLGSIADALAGDVCDWFPSWREARQLLPAISIAIRHGVGAFVQLLREERPHTAAELERVASHSLPPLGSGVTLEDLLQSLLVAFDRVWDEVQASAKRVPGVDPAFFLMAARVGHHFFCDLMLNLNRRYLESDRRAWLRAEDAHQMFVEYLLLEPAAHSDAVLIAPAIGIDVSHPMQVAVVAPPAGDGTAHHRMALIRERFHNVRRGVALAMIDERAVVVAETDATDDVFGDLPPTAGVGGTYSGTDGIRRSYTEAIEALETAQTRGLSSLHYADAWFDRFLAGRIPPSALAEVMLRPVDQLPDNKRRAAYSTLEAYLDSGGSIVETAARLHLHPQSVRYRLGKLRSQLGLALASPEQRLALHVALKHHASETVDPDC